MERINDGMVFVIGLGTLSAPILNIAYDIKGWPVIVYMLLVYFMVGFSLRGNK